MTTDAAATASTPGGEIPTRDILEWSGASASLLTGIGIALWSLVAGSRQELNIGLLVGLAAYYVLRLRASTAYACLGFLHPGALVLVYFVQAALMGQYTYGILESLGITHARQPDGLLLAARCYALGFAAFMAGDAAAALLRRPPSRVDPEPRTASRVLGRRIEGLVLAVFCAGTAGILMFYALRGVPILQGNVESGRIEAVKGMNYVYALALQLTNAAILMAFFRIPRLLELRWALIGLAMFLLLTLGYRAPVAIFLFAMVVWYSTTRRTIHLVAGFVVSQALLSLGLIAGFFRALVSGSMDAGLTISWLVNGFVEFRELAYSLDVVKEGALQGATYVAGVLLFVPSAVFPGKPDGLGLLLKSALYDETYQGGGIRVGMVGEAALNFGLPGVFAILLALGFLSCLAATYLVRIRQDLGRGVTFCLYAYFLYSTVGTLVGGDFAGFVFAFFRDSLIIALAAVACLAFDRVPSPPAAPTPTEDRP